MSSSRIKQLGINAKNAASKLTNIQAEKKNKALDYLKRDLKSLSSKIAVPKRGSAKIITPAAL